MDRRFHYIWTAEGWLYVAAVVDLFSRRVVGWAIIAQILGLSPRTVNKHLEQIYSKLGVENRTAAAAVANANRKSAV